MKTPLNSPVRSAIAIAPAAVGMLLVAALLYWGERGRQAPFIVLVIAIVATIASLVVSWRLSHYLDPAKVLRDAEANRDRAAAAIARAEFKASESDAVLRQIVEALGSRIHEVQLPLHILLDAPFGALNENQEELVGAARDAAESADRDLRLLRRLLHDEPEIADPERITVGALVAPALSVANSAAESALVRIVVDIDDGLPMVRVLSLPLQEAMTTVLTTMVAESEAGGELRVAAVETRGSVELSFAPAPSWSEPSLALRLARRTMERVGGLEVREGEWGVRLRAV